jgi:hypothetical protein
MERVASVLREQLGALHAENAALRTQVVGNNEVADKVRSVRARVAACSAEAGRAAPRLVAVSKTKPQEAIVDAMECGQLHFGENYVAEMVEKAHALSPSIQWHFIGHLQSNKVKLLLSIKNLFMIETVDSEKLAAALNKESEKQGKQNPNDSAMFTYDDCATSRPITYQRDGPSQHFWRGL